MTADPALPSVPPNTIDVGEGRAVVVPLTEYRMMKSLAARATAEERDEAWFEAAVAEAEEWKAAGRPGGTVPHDLVMAEIEAAAQSMERQR